MEPIHYFTRILFLGFLIFCGCTNSEPDVFESGKCYEGNLVRAFCPSIAVVTVTNANIGIDWNYGGKIYKNALTIWNYSNSDSSSRNPKVYFTIDIDASQKGEKCVLPIPCQHWAYDQSSPEVSICVKTISNKTCGEL